MEIMKNEKIKSEWEKFITSEKYFKYFKYFEFFLYYFLLLYNKKKLNN